MISKPSNIKKLTKTIDIFEGLLIGAYILWFLILFTAIYSYTKKDSIALFIPVCTLIVVFLPIYQRIKALDIEIKSK